MSLENFGKLLSPPANKSLVRKWEIGKNIPKGERLFQIAKLGNITVENLLLNKKSVTHEILSDEIMLNKIEVGKRIKEIRLSLSSDKKMTLELFGNLLSPPANKSLVRKWENGQNLPKGERLFQIAKLGNVTVEYLLFNK